MGATTSATKTCSACGRETKGSWRGMCGNCYRIWRRDKLPPNTACAVCGRPYFRGTGSRATGQTCSRDCFKTWKRGRNQRNEPTDGAALLTRECEWCSVEFTVERRQVDKGFGRFCSLRCCAARKVVLRLAMNCERCGGSFMLRPNRLFFGCGRFCSRPCYVEARTAAKLPPEPERAERNYRRFRDEWLARAEGCERCGRKADLSLHHRVRTRERPDLLYAPENLEVLCRSCHARHHNEQGHTRIPEATA